MKIQIKHLLFLSATFLTFISTASAAERWVTQTAHISFFSSTPAEDIEANNNSVVVVVNANEKSLGFSVPMQAFQFKKATMQKHFNSSKFLNTKKFPQATFKGTISDADKVEFSKDGEYKVTVSGTMTIKGVEQPVSQSGIIKVSGKTVSLSSEFDLTLTDYEIAFKKGKPSTNIAKTIKIIVDAQSINPEASA